MNNIMVYPVKFSFCFSSYTNSRPLVESNQNLPIKGANCTDLHVFEKRFLQLRVKSDWQISDKQNYIFQKS